VFSAFSSSTYEVQRTAELRRVAALPRRVWTAEEAEQLADQLTAILRTATGAMRLRPMQAVALAEVGMVGGLFGILRVGAGKTIVSLLAPVVAEAERPLLIIPAGLVAKTRRDYRMLREHWEIPEPRIATYEWLATAGAANALDELAPDLIVADESHKLKNPKAAVTRRVRRFMNAHPATKFVAMSGTITKRSILDYAHVLRWALKDAAPLPANYSDLEAWADALDARKRMLRQARPGALVDLCVDEADRANWDVTPRDCARRAYRQRLIETPGVVATETSSVDASIVVRAVAPPKSAAIDAAFDALRQKWELPDGEPIMDAPSMWRHAREIALGFYYRWNPKPPRAWLDARRTWAAFVRQQLSGSRTIDTEAQVKQRFPNVRELTDWLAVEATFTPTTELVWIDDSVVKLAADWLLNDCGIMWVEHVLFAEALAQRTRVPYYGGGNASDAEKHPAGASMILSTEAGREGLNLQAWSSNFILSAPPNNERWEQLLGRTHRDGQEADEVTFDVAAFSHECVESFFQARRDAEYVAASLGSPQKLLVADHDFPALADLAVRKGRRWNK
jgi:hypothetical protein